MSRGVVGEAGSSGRAALSYCIQQVRQSDYENYLWSVQLPKAVRAAVFALRAFNVEVAMISENVSQSALQQIRFQWWREAVNSVLTDRPVKHPVIEALSQISLGLPDRYHLQRIVSAREKDALSPVPPGSCRELEDYAEGTMSQLLFLQCKAAALMGPEIDHAASHLGKAVGLAALLRGTAHHALRRRCYLPMDLCAAEGVSQEDIYRGQASSGLSHVVFQVASVAKAHLEQAQDLRSKLPAEAVAMMMPAVTADLYLRALEKHQFNIFTPALANGGFSPLWYQLRLKYCMLRKTY
ncbi:hypothetical protein WJX73_001804 [Symbiochloris irregularis]|uniref:Phytoene synthase n=1 Tax=Symbiochloris irregularis TaxID=706552 RepID=A0AAW1P490_9CHLO